MPFDLSDIWRLALWGVAIILVAQLSAIITLTVSARVRRGRVPEQGFPKIATDPVQVEDSILRVYMDGRSLFDEMLAAIDNAQKTIYLETFIWKDDALGRRFKEALIARAEAGVDVYVIYDVLGNFIVPYTFKKFPDSVNVLPFLPWRSVFDLLSPRSYGVDHRKILVVDDDTGFVGGYNIGELYRTEWRDTHLYLTGPAVLDLAYAFVDTWNGRTEPERHIPLPDRPWSSEIRVHRNDPGRLSFPIRAIFLEAVEHAKKHILVTNAYFVPDPSIRLALLRAAERGVDVRILVPWQSNHILADWLARHHFTGYLRGGIRLFGYQGGMIHAKTATIDGVWSMIGTANLDRLSLAGNFEINVEIFDETVASQMEAIFACDVDNSREITLEDWQRRPVLARAGEFILSPLWPWV